MLFCACVFPRTPRLLRMRGIPELFKWREFHCNIFTARARARARHLALAIIREATKFLDNNFTKNKIKLAV